MLPDAVIAVTARGRELNGRATLNQRLVSHEDLHDQQTGKGGVQMQVIDAEVESEMS
ncbi:Uncharacterised protein [Mycobacteroides abscessus subsp. abscessus]|nr:Uncharacterised protein [Mycobacteroides abscessus subsp. abscessus]